MSERCMVIGCEQPAAVLDEEEHEIYCEEHAELNDVRLGAYRELDPTKEAQTPAYEELKNDE